MGNPTAQEFQINQYTTGDQMYPSVGAFGDGEFIVTWYSSETMEGIGKRILHRRIDSSGFPFGEEMVLEAAPAMEYANSHVSTQPQGSFVIAWEAESFVQDYVIAVQPFDAQGVPGATVFPAGHVGYFLDPRVGLGADESFIVVWVDDDGTTEGGGSSSINARHFNAQGHASGLIFQANTYTSFNQWHPTVSNSGPGDFVVVWQSYGPFEDDFQGSGIRGRQWWATIFRDGFESADTTAWSATLP